MMLPAGGYSGPRAACGAVVQPAKNARYVAAAMRRSRTDTFECLGFMRFRGIASNVITSRIRLATRSSIPPLVVRLTRPAVVVAFKGQVR